MKITSAKVRNEQLGSKFTVLWSPMWLSPVEQKDSTHEVWLLKDTQPETTENYVVLLVNQSQHSENPSWTMESTLCVGHL